MVHLKSQSEINFDEHENQANVKKVSGGAYSTRIDEASATITYLGKAKPGSLTSEAKWQIQRIDTSSGTIILFADGDGEFDNVWDNRASLTYS